MSHRMSGRALVTTAALVASALLATGASAAGPDASPTTARVATTPDDGTTEETMAGSVEGGVPDVAVGDIPEAAALLEALLVKPTQLPTTEPIGAPVPTGLTIDWIVCGVPECTALTAPLEAAAAALGWTVNSIDAGLTPETVQAAWNLAVQNEHDAVVATGFPRVMFADQLAQLEAAGIPVVNGYTTDEPGDGVIASTSGGAQAFADQGKFEAHFVTGRIGTEANTLFLGGSTFPGMDAVQDGFEAEYKRLCADCEFDSLDIPFDTIGTTLPANVVTYLTTHPDVNYIVLGIGSMVLGLPEALEAGGFDVKIVGTAPTTTTAQMVADGDIDGIIMVQAGDSMWQMVDALARHFAGVSVEPSLAPSPAWAVVAGNVDQLTGDPYVLISEYEALYKAMWGVS